MGWQYHCALFICHFLYLTEYCVRVQNKSMEHESLGASKIDEKGLIEIIHNEILILYPMEVIFLV